MGHLWGHLRHFGEPILYICGHVRGPMGHVWKTSEAIWGIFGGHMRHFGDLWGTFRGHLRHFRGPMGQLWATYEAL